MANIVVNYSESKLEATKKETPNEVFVDLNTTIISKSSNGTLGIQKCTLDIQKLTNFNAVNNSLKNIFQWVPGERILNPQFGSKLRQLLYSSLTSPNVESIIAEIRGSVMQFDPRISINNIYNITTDEDKENNKTRLRIVYSIPSLTKDKEFYFDYV